MEYMGSYLPHIQPFFAKFFITIVEHNQEIIDFLKQINKSKEAQIQEAKKNAKDFEMIKHNINKKYFGLFDNYLHNSKNKYFNEPEIAEIITNRLKKFDGIYYDLMAYCIMPNHVHFLIDMDIQKHFFEPDEEVTPDKYFSLQKIMQLIKGGSAREINQVLNKKGTVWLKDYWDHFIRTDKEEENVVNYIKMNPVKAELINDCEEWEFTFVRNCD